MTASKPGAGERKPAGSAGGRRLADLVDRALLTPRDAWRLGRRTASDRVERLRARGWFIAQSAIGAGLAWFVAGTLLHHVAPFLAPIAALIVLGQSYGQRIRRTLEVVVGVAIGVAVGDLFRVVFGVGWWQVTVVVLVAMVVALLFGAGQLMVTQAAAQGVVVTAIVLPHGPFDRWIDALVGALIALVLTLVAPSKPLREPRRLAAAALREIADILEAAFAAVVAGDQEAAEEALSQARETGEMLTRLSEAVQEGMAAGSVSIRRARNLAVAREVEQLTTPTDRAARNLRVLTRRLEVAIWRREPLDQATVQGIEDLARTCRSLAESVESGQPAAGRADLERLAAALAAIPGTASLSDAVACALLRSIVVDLLEVTGLSHDQARDLMPPAPAGSG
jgi:uncharacterized membrane protein YgaE (UPF0421/DUF939 family)